MSSVVIKQPFTCASCGGRFTYRHECPVRLSTTVKAAAAIRWNP